jgi:hypothetical protein
MVPPLAALEAHFLGGKHRSGAYFHGRAREELDELMVGMKLESAPSLMGYKWPSLEVLGNS